MSTSVPSRSALEALEALDQNAVIAKLEAELEAELRQRRPANSNPLSDSMTLEDYKRRADQAQALNSSIEASVNGPEGAAHHLDSLSNLHADGGHDDDDEDDPFFGAAPVQVETEWKRPGF